MSYVHIHYITYTTCTQHARIYTHTHTHTHTLSLSLSFFSATLGPEDARRPVTLSNRNHDCHYTLPINVAHGPRISPASLLPLGGMCVYPCVCLAVVPTVIVTLSIPTGLGQRYVLKCCVYAPKTPAHWQVRSISRHLVDVHSHMPMETYLYIPW
ncbi:hypothetical protein CGRA01v4_14368 [Colletotrichum graminicola]|nr:hypothetical protein CGRA01v4_14368 [Colletotrichum graminicola]